MPSCCQVAVILSKNVQYPVELFRDSCRAWLLSSLLNGIMYSMKTICIGVLIDFVTGR